MVTADIQPIIEKIEDLKQDFTAKFKDLNNRLDKYESQNINNFEKIIKNSEQCKSLQNELNEHKKNDQFYGIKQSEDIEALKKADNKIIISIIISAVAGGSIGGGLGKVLNILF